MLRTQGSAYRDSSTPFQAGLALSAEPSSVAQGRIFIREILESWDLATMGETVALVASELITNALLHADSPPTVQLEYADHVLRLEIADASLVRPRKRAYASDATTGRGMLLVDSMTARWGTELRSQGKIVWCEFDCP